MNAWERSFTICCLLALFIVPACDENRDREPTPDADVGDMDVKEENRVDSSHLRTRVPDDHAQRWLLSPFGEASAITATSDVEDLRRIWGAEAVHSPTEILLEEGESLPGAILFADDPERRLEVVWNNPREQASPFRIILRGHSSQWQLPTGIGLGISMDSLVNLNGRPISLLGFGWDNEGNVTDWNLGELQTMEDPRGSVKVFLEPDSRAYQDLSSEQREQISGDQVIASDHPVCREVRPVVSKIIVEFRGTEYGDFE